MAQSLNKTISFEDYLAGERDVDFRSEFVDGQIYAMAGASETHNTLSASFFLAIGNHLMDDCRAWQSDMKVIGNNESKDFAYYPDIMAACGENTGDQYARTNPILIAEVLSPSTQRTDLTEKLYNYTSISSLIEYVLISQDVPLVRLYRRRQAWKLENYYAEDRFALESMGIEVDVMTIYQRVRREVGLDVGE
jgi:Uma2 family endonuclease